MGNKSIRSSFISEIPICKRFPVGLRRYSFSTEISQGIYPTPLPLAQLSSASSGALRPGSHLFSFLPEALGDQNGRVSAKAYGKVYVEMIRSFIPLYLANPCSLQLCWAACAPHMAPVTCVFCLHVTRVWGYIVASTCELGLRRAEVYEGLLSLLFQKPDCHHWALIQITSF